MALNPSTTPSHAPSTSAAAGALGAARANSKSRRAEAGEDGGFAAELQRAQPSHAKSPDADAACDSDKAAQTEAPKGRDDEAPTVAPDANAAATAAPATPAQSSDQNALQWAQQQLAAAQAAKDNGTVKLDAKGEAADLAKGLAALRKGAAGKGQPGEAAALAGPEAKTASAGKTGADAAAVQGLGLGDGAANSATGTRDGLAALLPQPEAAVPVQAGAVGANPGALLDAGPSAPAASAPAQATLPMTPQSPAFAPALGQQIEVWLRDGVQHAEVQLNPLDLGPIRVRIAVEGAATRVEMHADVASTRDALQQALPQLSDSLGQVGLSLSGGGVSDQSTAQSQAQSPFADGQGGAGRSGATRSRLDGAGGHGDEVASGAALATRQASQRRGLLDLYA